MKMNFYQSGPLFCCVNICENCIILYTKAVEIIKKT